MRGITSLAVNAMTASGWLKSVQNTVHYAPPSSLHNGSVEALHQDIPSFGVISVRKIADPVGDRVYGQLFHANDGGRSGRDRAPAGAENPNWRGALGLYEAQYLVHVGQVGVPDVVGCG